MRSYLLFLLLSLVLYKSWAQVDESTTRQPKKAGETEDPCTNARGLSGKCVSRKRCNYGTDAIDKTLYAPFGFRRPCSADEVCCPNDYIAPIVEEIPDQIPYDDEK